MNEKETLTKNISFAALDRYVEKNIVSPTESATKSDAPVVWGDGNSYPDYLLSLYKDVTTLRSVVDGCVDYTCGNGATTAFLNGRMNHKGETADDIVRQLALNKFIYGGMAIQVIRNGAGNVSEIYALPVRYLRTNKECDVFWYSEEWNGRFVKSRAVVYPKFIPGTNTTEEHASSVLYKKGVDFQVYPAPPYAAAVKSCEIERNIDDFHLNALANGFMGSFMFNFNNGIPTDEIKEEIERNFSQKYTGHANSGRVVFSWNRDKDAATTVERIDVQDFGEKYKTLAAHSQRQIFAAFRANANLFGIPTENNGFNAEEYDSAFKLFNRTMIKPVQMQIADMFDTISGVKNTLTIQPFTMDGNERVAQ